MSEFVKNTDHNEEAQLYKKEQEPISPAYPLKNAMKPLTSPVILYDTVLRKKMHKDYFTLIQTALQSGPMSGSKPGKFYLGQENVAVTAEKQECKKSKVQNKKPL